MRIYCDVILIEPEAGPTSLYRTVTAGNPFRNTAIQIQNCKNTEILNTEITWIIGKDQCHSARALQIFTKESCVVMHLIVM